MIVALAPTGADLMFLRVEFPVYLRLSKWTLN